MLSVLHLYFGSRITGAILLARSVAHSTKLCCEVPYISRVFNFASFANLESFTKFIELKFESPTLPRTWATRIREIFSMNSFKTAVYLQKFRPAKYKYLLNSCLQREQSQRERWRGDWPRLRESTPPNSLCSSNNCSRRLRRGPVLSCTQSSWESVHIIHTTL